jgi:DNA-binding transcriptional MerR regulator
MKLFYTTDEVVRHLNIPQPTLEFYLKTFKININKTGKTRKFAHKDIEKLEKIVELVHIQGFTLEGAKEKLKEKSQSFDAQNQIIDRLKEIRNTLNTIKNALEE